jgi:hypothetical protein
MFSQMGVLQDIKTYLWYMHRVKEKCTQRCCGGKRKKEKKDKRLLSKKKKVDTGG